MAVKRGAVCNTDHHLAMVKAKVWRDRKRHRAVSGARVTRIRRYDVGKFFSKEDEGQVICDKYQEKVLELANEAWSEEDNVVGKWEAVRGALTSAAEDVLGTTTRRQPDWFQESQGQLKPLFKRRNDAYSRWLGSGKQANLTRFRKARGEARRAVRNGKNAWFLEKAKEVEREHLGGKKVWRCIQDMLRGRRGLLPSRVVTIHDVNGVPCVSTSAQHHCWRQHFTKVLNIMSEFDQSELDLVRQREVDDILASVPSTTDVRKALSKLKNGRQLAALGSSLR